ncbi:MAG: response regulator [Nitrospirae bacterium]|nr:response regulator [Nitrospirota bacterium]MBF0536410.1 response regulator [Nitrospirota bacterium]MBF0618332.1 response regulator [Nitrospirota bacterium]
MTDILERLKALTVLYVEDEDITRESLGKFIRRRVKTLYVAENGKAGLEIFLKENPDVVITDIEMPLMNGHEMIEKIREHSSNVPIIVTTAYNDEQHTSDAVNAVFIKPIIQDDLMRAISSCF